MTNPFEELDDLEQNEDLEMSPRIKDNVIGSYSATRDIFKGVSILTNKIFTVLTGFLHLFGNDPDDKPNF